MAEYKINPNILFEKISVMDPVECRKWMMKLCAAMQAGKATGDFLTKVVDTKAVTIPKEYSTQFLSFWDKYHPKRKGGKKVTFTGWIRSGIDQDELLKMCLKTLEWQSRSDQWLKDNGDYWPQASTWINGARWEDENPNQGAKMIMNDLGQMVEE